MRPLFAEFLKYCRVYALFASNCFMAQIEYRSNFLIVICMELAWLIGRILILVVMYETNISINGISPDGVLLYLGTFSIMIGIFNIFFLPNFYSISGHIRNGSLDVLMTKPISLQFLLTLRTLEFIIPLPTIVVGAIMVILSWSRLHVPFSLENIFGYMFYMGVGSMACYVVFLLPQLLAFWLVKIDVILISETMWEFNSMPMNIYNKWIQRFGFYVIPVLGITNLPVLYILKKLTFYSAILPIIVLVTLFIFQRFIWKFAIKNYSGASS